MKQNWDILRGKISTEYSLTNPVYPLSPFDGIFTEYHDANLFIMEEVHPLAEVMAQIKTKGSMTSILGETRPWMLRVNMSDLPAGDNLNAVGYAWKCASPLTGVFFFPKGGLVSTQIVTAAGYVSVDNLKTGEDHEYAWDIVSHVILCSTGRGIPPLEPAHKARKTFAQYYQDYSDAYRSLEFADLVSSQSQTYPVWLDLSYITRDKAQAAREYREGHVESSGEMMQGIILRIESVRIRAEKALRISLFTTHLVQYSAIGSTLLISLLVTMYFVYNPRTKTVGTTRAYREDLPGGVIRPVHVRPRFKMIMGAVLVIILTAPVVAILWDQVTEYLSWGPVYSEKTWYQHIGIKPEIYAGRLVPREFETNRIIVDRSKGIAWIPDKGEGPPPGTITSHVYWPYELVRRGQDPLPIHIDEFDQRTRSFFEQYVGLEVEIKGKIIRSEIFGENTLIYIQGARELVPGSIRVKPEHPP